ncbi:molecular chaperone DnaJ [Barnesiella sp. WM24]|nr:molecular chaperone DnaJ [Barnesiella sp. WM24]
MEKEIKRPPRIAVCRECNGTGLQQTESPQRYPARCSQCDGSGRVTVSSVMRLDIRPYKPIPLN